MEKFKISIITVCYNAEQTIEKTISSVKEQSYPLIEYIIIDGNSSDSTLSRINNYQDFISKIISEKDKGIYDAMNKGLALSSGDIVYFLNSGDYLFDSKIIEKIMKYFSNNPNIEILYGDVIDYTESDTIFKVSYRDSLIKFFSRGSVCHQGIFAKREIFKRYSSFDCKLKIFADYDWLLRNILKKTNIKYYSHPICFFQFEGLSRNQGPEYYHEWLYCLIKNFPYSRFISMMMEDIKEFYCFTILIQFLFRESSIKKFLKLFLEY